MIDCQIRPQEEDNTLKRTSHDKDIVMDDISLCEAFPFPSFRLDCVLEALGESKCRSGHPIGSVDNHV